MQIKIVCREVLIGNQTRAHSIGRGHYIISKKAVFCCPSTVYQGVRAALFFIVVVLFIA